MKLYEAMEGKRMPCGEGECVANWGWLLSKVMKNRVKELELTGEEIFALIQYLIQHAVLLLLNVDNYENFRIFGIQIKRIEGEFEEARTRILLKEYIKKTEQGNIK